MTDGGECLDRCRPASGGAACHSLIPTQDLGRIWRRASIIIADQNQPQRSEPRRCGHVARDALPSPDPDRYLAGKGSGSIAPTQQINP